MRKICAFALVLILICGIALAAEPTYSSTQKVKEILETAGMKVICKGVDDDKNDVLYLDYNEDGISYTIRLFFDETEEHCCIRVWYLLNVAKADVTDMIRACNTANGAYKWAKFYVDERDNTVSVDMDLIFNKDDNMALSVLEGVLRLEAVIAAAYPDLSLYGK